MVDDKLKRWFSQGGISTEEPGGPSRPMSPPDRRRSLELWAEGQAHLQGGRFGRAIAPLRRALSLLESGLGAHDPLLFDTLRALGDAYHYLGVRSDARKTYERILAIHERHHLDEDSLLPVLENLADVLSTTNQVEEEGRISRWIQAIRDRGVKGPAGGPGDR